MGGEYVSSRSFIDFYRIFGSEILFTGIGKPVNGQRHKYFPLDTMPGRKPNGFLPGIVLQPLLGCQLRFYSCAGGASVPLWSMGTACRPIEEYMGRRPRWRVFGRCRGIRASRPPGGDVRAGACALISIQEKYAVGGQTATGAGRASVPPLSLS